VHTRSTGTATRAELSLGRGPRSPLVPPIAGAGCDNGGSRDSFVIVHADPVLTTASDASVQINLPLASLAAPLGGDVVAVVARQANGDPLPDWLKFDPATGSFVGLPPDGVVASIERVQSADGIVTDALPPKPDLGV